MINTDSGSRGRFWRIVIVAIVVVAGGLGILGYLLLSSPLAKVTVSGGTVTIEEGQGPHGWWFSPPHRNVSGSGYPLSLSGGATFQVPIVLANTDTANHSVSSVEVASPFSVVSSSSPLPATVAGLSDTTLVLTLKAPLSAGTYSFNVTVICAS
ncbi:MAG TPA: hypothetical protein VGV89_10155 [Thermoplasmata archaeon]|nr:hypothetical protein [Thermoplasmata archaeon]